MCSNILFRSFDGQWKFLVELDQLFRETMRLNASVNEPVAPILHLAQDKPHLLLDKWLFSAHIIIPIMYYKSYVDIR